MVFCMAQIFHIFASLAEFERSIIRERTNAGLKAARQNGRIGGRPSSLTEKDLAVAIEEVESMLENP